MSGEILNPKIEAYLDELLPKRDSLLNEMEKLARRRDIPIIGPACGRLLYLLAKISGAKRVFEMGSAIGYSTIWFARAIGPRGEVYYTDSDASNARRAREYFARAGVERRIKVLIGDALKSLEKTPGKFDIILIDVDKPQYVNALHIALAQSFAAVGCSSPITRCGTVAWSTARETKAPAQSRNSTAELTRSRRSIR